jgi:hypothetical protein
LLHLGSDGLGVHLIGGRGFLETRCRSERGQETSSKVATILRFRRPI